MVHHMISIDSVLVVTNLRRLAISGHLSLRLTKHFSILDVVILLMLEALRGVPVVLSEAMIIIAI